MATGGIVLTSQLPAQWSRPVINTVILPAHAQTTTPAPPPCDFSLTLELVDAAGKPLAADGSYAPQEVFVQGTLTPAPGAIVPVQLDLYANDNFLGGFAMPALPNGNFITSYYLGTGVGPPGGIEKFTVTHECASAEWSASVLPNP